MSAHPLHGPRPADKRVPFRVAVVSQPEGWLSSAFATDDAREVVNFLSRSGFMIAPGVCTDEAHTFWGTDQTEPIVGSVLHSGEVIIWTAGPHLRAHFGRMAAGGYG